MRILRSLPLCKGLPHLRGTGRSTARAVLWGERHAGSKGNPQKSSMRRMTPSGSAPSASYCAPPSSRRAPAETRRPACARRLRTGAPLLAARPRQQAFGERCSDAWVFSSSFGRVARRGTGPVVTSFAPSPLARRFLDGKTCYVLTNCINFADVINRRRG